MAIAIWFVVASFEAFRTTLHIFSSINFIHPILFNGFYVYGFYFILIGYHWMN